MLLQQFNHEADPVMFAPPHRIWGEMPPPTALPPPLPPLAGRTESAEMRLQELAGLTTTPSAPTGWVMPQTGYKLDPLDQEFGMTLKSRWEVMGRPGILQIPTTDEFFEHEDLFGYQPPPNAGSLGRRKSTTLHAGAAGDGMSVMGMPGMPGIPGMPGTSLAPMTGLEPGQGHQMAPMELRMVAPQHFQAGDGGYPAAPTDSEMQTEGDDMPSLVVTLKRGLSQRFSLDRPKSGNETAENPDVERAESGIQVSWSPSGGLYLPETEKHKLKLFSTEGSDDEHHAMMDLTAVNPQRISTMEQVSKFPMLDLLRSQTGVSSPLWEWETASDMFGVGHHGHGAQHAAHPGKVPLPSRYSVIHTT